MNNRSKYLTVLSALLLLTLFAFPLWRIALMAPQYPDGLSMYLYINDIQDGQPGDIHNINIMNHYVGMKPIHAEDFKEFTYFPIVVVSLCLLGLIAAFSGWRHAILIWVFLVCTAGILGVYDFYLWEYNYGHTLAQNAAIKIPGQAYQPPLIGRAQILNFIAYSYPQAGGWMVGISILLGFVAWFTGKK